MNEHVNVTPVTSHDDVVTHAHDSLHDACDSMHDTCDNVHTTHTHGNSISARIGILVDHINGLSHTPYKRINPSYVIVHKRMLDAISREALDIAMDAQEQDPCASCALNMRSEDMRVARETVDRLMRNANRNDSVVTKDEAKNLNDLLTILSLMWSYPVGEIGQ